MKFARFHDPEGNEVWIGVRWVTKIRPPIKGQHSVKAHAVLMMGQAEHAITETVEEALSILEEVDADTK